MANYTDKKCGQCIHWHPLPTRSNEPALISPSQPTREIFNLGFPPPPIIPPDTSGLCRQSIVSIILPVLCAQEEPGNPVPVMMKNRMQTRYPEVGENFVACSHFEQR